MPTDTRTSELVINKLSKQQYEDIQNPSDTELYLVPEDEEHKPICYPTTADNVGVSSMDLKSSVSDNGLKLTEVGFVYNTSGDPTVSDTKVICDLGCGNIGKSLSGLTLDTTYYIKSYGINQGGTSYGDLLTESTLPSPIPVEYQLVEYLESSGTQYILLNYIPNINDEIITKVLFNNSSQNYLYGCVINGNRCQFGIINGNLSIFNDRAMSNPHMMTQPYNANFNIFKLSFHYVDINSITEVNVNMYPAIRFCLFARNNNGTMDLKSYSRLEFFKVTNIIELYPVYRITDNKPGMYDIVNGVFYTNQGTGEFVVGPDAQWTD